MTPERIPISYCNSFLIRGPQGFLLVDTGNDSKARVILNYIKKQGLDIKDLKLIILTHVHFDHVMAASYLKQLSGAEVLVHADEARLLEAGTTPIPKGTIALTKSAHLLGQRLLPHVMRFPKMKADILVDGPYDLSGHGFPLEVIHTPGHTLGSISVVSRGNYAVVGDVLYTPFRLFWPPFANDQATLARTWHTLLEDDFPLYFPGHGPRTTPDAMRAKLKKLGMQHA